ncbi:MAG TPA: protein kinase [Ignavibacteriaceae bacterium]|nr:protein kinase [Ignavibacteriaceae bacterium]
MISENLLHYKILEKLGEGGMGIVYKAHDSRLERTVALKFLPQYLSADLSEKERFYHEARAAASLNHQNVAIIYEIGEYERNIFLAMEYVEGQTLKKMIENKSESLSIKKVLEMAIQICEGMEAAHEKGIVHRDIKSDNIMMTSKGQIKIMDFGLAKLKGASRITQAGSTVGTAAYMSPEQAQGEEVDFRSDIFSFGVVLYELLTTNLPFSGEHQAALMYSLLNEDPQPVARFNNKVSPELERIVFKALAKDKEERYQHIDDILADLRRERKNLEYAKSGYVKAADVLSASVKKETVIGTPGKKKLLRIIVPASVVIILLIIFLLLNPFKSSAVENLSTESKNNSLAVMYFENIPDPADNNHNSEMLTNLLITSLSQVKGLEVISRERLLDIQKDLGQSDKTISASFANNVAKHAGVTTMLIGSILQEEPVLAVTTRLIDVQSGRIISSQQVTNFKANQIFNLVDTLAVLVQDNLRSTSPAEIKSVSEVTTKSPEAYRAYLAGIELMDKIYWKEAIAAFSRAIQLDKNFAMAYYYLSRSQNGLGETEASQISLKTAVDLSDNATEHERLQIMTTNYLRQNNLSKAIEGFEKIIEKYPHEIDSYVQLGYNAYDRMMLNPDKAIEVFNRALKIEPDSKTLWNLLAYSFAWAKKRQEAISAVNTYVNLVPAEPNPYDTRGDIYSWFGDYDSSRASYQMAIQLRSDFSSASKLGYLSVLSQNYNDAEKYFEEGGNTLPFIDMHKGKLQNVEKKILGLPDAEISKSDRLLILINLYYEMGKYPEMLQLAKQLSGLLKKNPSDKICGRDYLVWSLIKNGKSAEAQSVLDDIQKDVKNVTPILQVTADYSAALFSYEEGKYDLAIQKYRKVIQELPPNYEPNIFYAVTLLKTGQLSEAITELKRICEWPQNGDNFIIPFIPGAEYDWPIPAVKAHYWLGIAYEKQGNKQNALSEYKKFLEIWKDADFTSPELNDAKERIAKL